MGPEVLQKKFEDEVESYKKIQKDVSKNNQLRSGFDSQLNENKIVKEEMDLLSDDAVVYKLIGPALMRQDMTEARQTVNKRIEYITDEMSRFEKSIGELENQGDAKKESITKLQTQLQQALVKAAAAAPPVAAKK